MFPGSTAISTIAIAAAMALGATVPGLAQFSGELQAQAQCELAAIGTTRSRLAIDWIRTACNRLAVDGPLNESNRPFYGCLITNLSGVQNDYAANRIINSCRTAYPP